MSAAEAGDGGLDTGGGDGDQVLDLNFVPQWARRPPDAMRFARFDDDAPAGRRGGERNGRERRGRQEDDRSRRRERPADTPGRRGDGGDGRPPGGDAMRASAGGRAPVSPAHRQTQDREPPAAVAAAEALPLNVRFLPERKPLSDLIRRVSAGSRAYALLDLASLLMSKEGFCYVRIDVPSSSGDLRLYQCRHCRTLTLGLAPMEAHVLEDHLDLFFEVAEETAEPPSGVFVCVAKCGYSGALLGPPNHHGYAEAVKRVHAERFANLDIETYRRHIRMSHEPDDVERWKEEFSKRVVYRLKETGEEKSWSEVQRYLRTVVVPASYEAVRRVVLSEKEAHAVRDPAIRRTIRIEWQEESRFPIHLAFALRAAFRHRGLYQFKTGRGQGKGVNFVTAVKPVPLDPESAIPEIRDALLFLRAHPGCTRQTMVEALRPGADPGSDEVKSLLQPIHWLSAKGHIIEFFNGTLSVPMAIRR